MTVALFCQQSRFELKNLAPIKMVSTIALQDLQEKSNGKF